MLLNILEVWFWINKISIILCFLGRTRLEPIAIVVLSVIMCSASVEVIFESGQTLSQDVQYFTHQNNASSTYTLPEINMTVVPIVAMVLTIGKLNLVL
jgi:hypothetical protein